MRLSTLLQTTALCFALARRLGGTAAHAADPAAALADIGKNVMSLGPNGEKPESADTVKLTDDEMAKIKAMHAKAAIVMHYAGNDWSQAQIEGLKAQFAKMGIDVIATTDAGFKPDKQVADIETVLAQKPNIIVSIPTDPTATANEYKAAADAGVKLVFMDNVPKGFVAGKDYVSVVSADNYGNGVASAHLLARRSAARARSASSSTPPTSSSPSSATTPSRRRSPTTTPTSRSWPSRASAVRTSPAMPRRPPAPCWCRTAPSRASGRCGTCRPRA